MLNTGAISNTGRRLVSIDKLVEDPENERKTFDDMDDLVASIIASGIVEPLTVIALEGDKYQITTGHRRFRAARIAGLAQIEVLIREPEETPDYFVFKKKLNELEGEVSKFKIDRKKDLDDKKRDARDQLVALQKRVDGHKATSSFARAIPVR